MAAHRFPTTLTAASPLFFISGRLYEISGRLFAYSAHASACALRQSPNANGRSDSLSDLMFLYSRQHHSQTLRVCSVMFSWTFAVAPLVAAPRLLKGRSVGKALPHFRSEPYISRRLSVCNICAHAHIFRPSANAKGRSDSLSDLMFLYSRQRCSRRRALRAAVLHRFLALSLRSAHSRRASI